MFLITHLGQKCNNKTNHNFLIESISYLLTSFFLQESYYIRIQSKGSGHTESLETLAQLYFRHGLKDKSKLLSELET